MGCRRKPFPTRLRAEINRPINTRVFFCTSCGQFHLTRIHIPPTAPVNSYDAKRARVFNDFEVAIAEQMARIEERLSRSAARVRHANMPTIDNGPLTLEGGSVIAYRGDEVTVESKK